MSEKQSIALSQMLVLQLPQELITNCHLSVPGWDSLRNTNGLCRDKMRASKDPKVLTFVAGLDIEEGNAKLRLKLPYRSYDASCCLRPYEEHLKNLNLKPEDPWFLVGVRNLGNNLRIIGYDQERGLFELNGENATSGRKYCCLCKTKNGKLLIDRLSFPDGKPSRCELSWAVSGQELVWEGKPASIDEIIPYTYDLRHIWNIPGKFVAGMGRVYAGEPIEEMIDLFMEVKDRSPEEAAEKLKKLAKTRGYKRECNYLHSAIGISKDEETVIIVQRHGKFEDVAETLIHAGAYRAIELDQGGSCSVMLGGTSEFTPGQTILASHYFRPRGLALLIFELSQLSEETFTENSYLLKK